MGGGVGGSGNGVSYSTLMRCKWDAVAFTLCEKETYTHWKLGGYWESPGIYANAFMKLVNHCDGDVIVPTAFVVQFQMMF